MNADSTDKVKAVGSLKLVAGSRKYRPKPLKGM